MLYLVGTPIGNLDDMSPRAARTLGEVSLILAEDTRRTKPLLHHFEIETPLKSYHKFNERALLEEMIDRLEAGDKLALVSDAGMPLLADPGALLVQACHEKGIEVRVVPGPCSLSSALAVSGRANLPFQFVGFLTKRMIPEIEKYEGTSVCFIPPHDLQSLIRHFSEETRLTLCREMTKKFEQVVDARTIESDQIKGEMVLIVEPEIKQTKRLIDQPSKAVKALIDELGYSRKAAKEIVALFS
ncbi:MAG: Ribosomal RNA small subunit methyltransferase I [Chlamydiia bacterium]|nr:Ribosomal RNA small subunit methyltransferase I [Chlamydiia bacterium]